MESRNVRLEVVKMSGEQLLEQVSFVTETTIFRCVAGEATILLEGRECRFVCGTNFMVVDSAHLSVAEFSDDFRYLEIPFGRKTFNRIYTHIDTSIIGSLKASAPDLASAEEFRQSELTLDKILLLNQSGWAEHKVAIMRNLIFCYIYETHSLVQSNKIIGSDENSKFVNSLIGRFVILCREHHREHREIAFYSDALMISRRYLHTVVSEKLHLTPKEFIDSYVLTSAKELLLTTNQSAQQIAEALNFPDQSTFGQFFRRLTSFSPSQFRKAHI